MAAVIWKKTPRQAWSAGSKRYVATLQQAVFGVLQYYAAVIEAYAKQNASWQDRTGNARQTLSAGVEEMPLAVRLYLRHRMDYGIFLELANGGKYAILLPTLQHYQNEIWSRVKQVLK